MGIYGADVGFRISFLTGTPGTGKTLVMVINLVEERLRDRTVRLYTNMPLRVDEVAEYVAERLKCDPAEVAERIVIISPDLLKQWKAGRGGPWDLAGESGEEAQGWDLVLDEVHNFCPIRSRARMPPWEEWLGEARHEGWRHIVFISQDETKVGKPIKDHSELRFELTNSERRRDPFFAVPLQDWYELRAGYLTGTYTPCVFVKEYRRVGGRLREQHEERFWHAPKYFDLYQSYSKPGGQSGAEGVGAPVREFQRRGRFLFRRVDGVRLAPLWLWFVGRNFFPLSLRLAVASLIMWVTLFGGSSVIFGLYFDFWGGLAPGKETAEVDPRIKPGVDVTDREALLKRAADLRALRAGAVPTPAGGGPTLASPTGEVAARALVDLKADLAEEQAALQALAEEHARLLDRVRQAFAIAMIDDGRITFRGGGTYVLGATIDWGPYINRQIVNIDTLNRTVKLDDGTLLRMGFGLDVVRVWNPDAVEQAQADPSQVVERVRGAPNPRPVPQVGGAPAGATGELESGGYAPRGVRPGAGGSSRGEPRSGGVLGRGAGDD